MRSVIISVINDLATDQRVHRLAVTLDREGYAVRLVGRKLPGSLPVDSQAFNCHRFRMLFRRGPFFYAFYNLRLFLYLLGVRKPVLLIAVDLDTLPANDLVSRWRGIPLLYDSHEYFTQVPELVGRKAVRTIWERIERRIVPRLSYAIAVSDSISAAMEERYGTRFVTVRNVPLPANPQPFPEFHERYPARYKLIYQGALNVGRGIELMIDMMSWMEETTLIIAGDGDIRTDLQRRVLDKKLDDRVFFIGRIPPGKLTGITAECDIGLSLEEDIGLNYRFALPNKIFDYIQARVPVLCSDLPEMASLVRQYGVGEVCADREPGQLVRQITGMLHDEAARERWQLNLDRAAEVLNWEVEQEKFLKLVRSAVGEANE